MITGFSGKSQAMATFEDAGYFCVDNLPPEMIGSLADLFGHEGSQVERAAVASDVRDFFDGLVRVLDDLDDAASVPAALPRGGRGGADQPLQGDATPPPLADGGSVEAALRAARTARAAEGARRRLHRHERPLGLALRKVVADKMLPHGGVGKLAVTFMTFGFKHGSPRDADLTFDVRFLPNPTTRPSCAS